MSKIIPGARFEPYAFLKTALNVKSKDGKTGNSDTIYLGGRLFGKAPGSIDYSMEFVKEAGNFADDVIDALGYVGGGGWKIPRAPRSLRVSSDYSYASGDSGAKDGHHQNFDYLYASQSMAYSISGQASWKNGSAQEFVGRAGIAELGLNSQFADG